MRQSSILVLTATLVLAVLCCDCGKGKNAKVGRTVPDFQLTDYRGKMVDSTGSMFFDKELMVVNLFSASG
jgi:hypothetical protein